MTSPSARGPAGALDRVGPFLLFGAVASALFFGPLLLGETFVSRDLLAYYRPAKALVAPLARGSEGLPLWNPFFASGQPWAANPEHELWHPATALFLLLPFEWAFRLQVILPPLLSGAAFRFFLRSLGLGRSAALFGGLSWAFGGYLLSTTNLLPILLALAALPAVLAFVVRLARGAPASEGAALALFFGLEALAGEPSTLLMTAPLSLAAFAAGRTARPLAPRTTGAAARFVAAGFILGAAVGAATLLPGFLHARKTVRASGIPEADAALWSMPPVRLLELTVPSVLGRDDPSEAAAALRARVYPRRDGPFLASLYPGILVTAFALAAVGGRRRGPLAWWIVALAGALLAFGAHTPLWGLARRAIPLLAGLRYPEKFVLLPAFALVVVAATAWDERLRRRGALLPVAIAAAAVVSIGAILRMLRSSTLVLPVETPRLLVVGGVAVVVLLFAPKIGRRRAATLLLAILALDLATSGRWLLPTAPIAAVSSPPDFLAPLLKAPGEKTPLFHLAAFDPRRGRAAGLAVPPTPAQWGIPLTLEQDFDLTELSWSAAATDAVSECLRRDPALAGPLLARRGVGAVLRFRPGSSDSPSPLRTPRGESALELLRPAGGGRFAFFADRCRAAGGRESWIRASLELGTERATAVCLEPPDAARLDPAPSAGTVRMVRRSPTALVFAVEVEGPKTGLLAVNQTWDRGWRATVDGVPAPLFKADLSLCALGVPPGRHEVALRYRDPAVAAGLATTIAALLAAAVWGLAAPRRSVS